MARKGAKRPGRGTTRKTSATKRSTRTGATKRKSTKRVGGGSTPAPSSGAPSGGKAVQILRFKPGDPTKRLKKYYDDNPKGGPPIYGRETATPRSDRVRQVKHNRNGRKGKYATLVADEGDYHTSSLTTPPIPDIVIYRGWLYVNGTAPCVGTTAVIAQAEGCRLLLYYYTQSQHRYCRICYLEGNPESLVYIYTDPESAGKMGWLTPGTYADAEVNTSTDKCMRWKDSVTEEPSVYDLATLDETANPPVPKFSDVMAAVVLGIYDEPID
jgi:hypothetical protein